MNTQVISTRPVCWFEQGIWFCGFHKGSLARCSGRNAWEAFCQFCQWLEIHP